MRPAVTSQLDIDVDTVSMLKKMVCLLSCQPRSMASQLPQALDCLRSSVEALAVGIFWPGADGRLRPWVQRPSRYQLYGPLRQAVAACVESPDPAWGEARLAWLSVPMKVGGIVTGRLWVVAGPGREFGQSEREFVTMAGNQLALAIENARLYEEVQHLAARRAQFLRRVIASQDERCRRISRELHDEISQSLAAMALDLEAAQVTGGAMQNGALARLTGLRSRLLSALNEVNRIILDLRPTLLEDMGLLPALRWYAGQRLESSGVRIEVRTSGVGDRLPPHMETTLYRIGQEALTNVVKHAGARTVWLLARRNERQFTLSVRDDGRGFDVAAVLSDPDDHVGIGLFGMKERAVLVGGTFEVRSTPGKGTRVTVRIPLEGEVERAADSSLAG